MIRRQCPDVRLERGIEGCLRLQRPRDDMARVREDRALTETDPWTVRAVFGSLLVVERLRFRGLAALLKVGLCGQRCFQLKIKLNGSLGDDGRGVVVVTVSSNVGLEMIGARKGAVAQRAFEFTFARV